jgi:hypothetical protein
VTFAVYPVPSVGDAILGVDYDDRDQEEVTRKQPDISKPDSKRSGYVRARECPVEHGDTEAKKNTRWY